MRLLKSDTFSPLFSDSLDRLIVAINQKELIKKLTTEGLDPNAAQLKTQEYFQLARNNGKIVDWIMAREKEGLDFPKIFTFMDWFKRNLQNIPFQQRDIFKIDTKYINDTLSKQEKEETQQTQARSAKSIVFAEGPYSVVKADTPEAIMEEANCEGSASNSWCIKGLDASKSYGPPGFFIKKNGKLYAAAFPHKREIRNLVDEIPSEQMTNEIYPIVKFIIDKFYQGSWPSGHPFKLFTQRGREEFLNTLSPEEKARFIGVWENGLNIQFVRNDEDQTPALQAEAVKQNGNAIQYIYNPSPEIQLLAVRRNGYAIRYIPNPSEQLQLEAVKQDGLAIEYIPNPSEQVQSEAVKNFPYALKYIENQSERVQLEAIKKDTESIRFIKNPSEQMQLEAIRRNPKSIVMIRNPSERVQLEAVKLDRSVFPQLKHDKVYPSVVNFYNRLSQSDKHVAEIAHMLNL